MMYFKRKGLCRLNCINTSKRYDPRASFKTTSVSFLLLLSINCAFSIDKCRVIEYNCPAKEIAFLLIIYEDSLDSLEIESLQNGIT